MNPVENAAVRMYSREIVVVDGGGGDTEDCRRSRVLSRGYGTSLIRILQKDKVPG